MISDGERLDGVRLDGDSPGADTPGGDDPGREAEVTLDLVVRDERLAVCRLPATSVAPPWASGEGIVSLTWTGDELSIVAPEYLIPAGVECVRGWRPLMVVGPLAFGLTGILASIAEPLARAGVSIFALSTFDTDYVLVPEPELTVAVDALAASGHRVTMP